jgi:hypothetical protein
MTSPDTVTLSEAVDHGRAHHARSPHRIRKKGREVLFEVGGPIFGEGGAPEHDEDGELLMSWREVPISRVEKDWDADGWVLD